MPHRFTSAHHSNITYPITIANARPAHKPSPSRLEQQFEPSNSINARNSTWKMHASMEATKSAAA